MNQNKDTVSPGSWAGLIEECFLSELSLPKLMWRLKYVINFLYHVTSVCVLPLDHYYIINIKYMILRHESVSPAL